MIEKCCRCNITPPLPFALYDPGFMTKFLICAGMTSSKMKQLQPAATTAAIYFNAWSGTTTLFYRTRWNSGNQRQCMVWEWDPFVMNQRQCLVSVIATPSFQRRKCVATSIYAWFGTATLSCWAVTRDEHGLDTKIRIRSTCSAAGTSVSVWIETASPFVCHEGHVSAIRVAWSWFDWCASHWSLLKLKKRK